MKKIVIIIMLWLCSFSACLGRGEWNDKYPKYDNVTYIQGLNNIGASNTCIPAALANFLNLLTMTNNYSEQYMIDNCKHCRFDIVDGEMHTYFLRSESEAVREVKAYIEKHDGMDYDGLVCRDVSCFSAEKVAERFNEIHSQSDVINIAAYAEISTGVVWKDDPADAYVNHEIAIAGPLYDEEGTLIGFSIADTGAMLNFISKEDWDLTNKRKVVFAWLKYEG